MKDKPSGRKIKAECNAASGLQDICQHSFNGAVDTEGHTGVNHVHKVRKLGHLVETLFQEV